MRSIWRYRGIDLCSGRFAHGHENLPGQIVMGTAHQDPCLWRACIRYRVSIPHSIAGILHDIGGVALWVGFACLRVQNDASDPAFFLYASGLWHAIAIQEPCWVELLHYFGVRAGVRALVEQVSMAPVLVLSGRD